MADPTDAKFSVIIQQRHLLRRGPSTAARWHLRSPTLHARKIRAVQLRLPGDLTCFPLAASFKRMKNGSEGLVLSRWRDAAREAPGAGGCRGGRRVGRPGRFLPRDAPSWARDYCLKCIRSLSPLIRSCFARARLAAAPPIPAGERTTAPPAGVDNSPAPPSSSPAYCQTPRFPLEKARPPRLQ